MGVVRQFPRRADVAQTRCATSREELAAPLACAGVSDPATRFAPHGLASRAATRCSTPLADDGVFLVQDEASQLVADLLLDRLANGPRRVRLARRQDHGDGRSDGNAG